MRLVYIVTSWLFGLVLAANNTSGSAVVPLIWLGLSLLSLVTLRLCWPLTHQRLRYITLLMFTLGGLRMSVMPVTSQVAQLNNTGGLTLQGVVISEPDIRDRQTQFQLQTQTVTRGGQTFALSGQVLVQTARHTDIQYGDHITATGSLIIPAEFDTFSYADYLARANVFSIMRGAAVNVIEMDITASPLRAVYSIKQQAQYHISQSLPEPHAGLLSGILLGNESMLSPEVSEAFSRTGTSHIIAISGFNMVILSGAIMGLLRRARIRPGLAAFCGIMILAIYTVLVGANPAVVRAALMSALLVIASLLHRQTYLPASLAFVALLLTAHNPKVLWDVSFQLSFAATLGLALYTPPLTHLLDRLLDRAFAPSLARQISGFLAEPLLVTVAAQITTLPLIVLYFSRLSLLALPINLLIIPVQAALLIIGLLATLTAFISPGLAQILYWYTMLPLSWTLTLVRESAQLPFADVVFSVDPRIIILYYLLLIGAAFVQATQPKWATRLYHRIRQRPVPAITITTGLATLFLVIATLISRPDGQLHLWLLDVGHSNAVLLQTPGGAQILIDGGSFPSRLLTAIGDRMPFNDREIDVLVLTQPDENEYAALSAVLDRYATGVILTNGHLNLSRSYEALQQRMDGRLLKEVLAGDSLTLDDGVRIDVLHPQARPQPGDSLDDFAIVLRIQYQAVSFLLTSDLSSTGQQLILEQGHWPQATVLQLPQHGSSRSLSDSFVTAVQPQVAIVQADKANRRGDPDPDTLAQLGGVPVYRTDTDGPLHLWTDGESLWVQAK